MNQGLPAKLKAFFPNVIPQDRPGFAEGGYKQPKNRKSMNGWLYFRGPQGGEFSSKRKATTKSGNGDPEVSKKSALER